jgi:hypothetical protein
LNLSAKHPAFSSKIPLLNPKTAAGSPWLRNCYHGNVGYCIGMELKMLTGNNISAENQTFALG